MTIRDDLLRIERKIDLVLQLQGVALTEIEDIEHFDQPRMQALIAKLKASEKKLRAATAANQPPTK